MIVPRIALDVDCENQTIEITFLNASIAEDENEELIAGGAFSLDAAVEVHQLLGQAIVELRELR